MIGCFLNPKIFAMVKILKTRTAQNGKKIQYTGCAGNGV